MRRKLIMSLVLALLFIGSGSVAGQTVVAPGDIAVVTSTGFWRLRAATPQGQPVNFIAPSAFNAGFSTLTTPRLDWERDTDGFLVCTGTNLYRATLTSTTTATITDLTPNVGGTAAFVELDIHPGTGELYLFDQIGKQVFRFAPPFTLNMTPDLVLPSGAGIRAMCIDSRDYPPSVTVATSSQTDRLPLDGSTAIPVMFTGGGGLDGDPRYGRSFLINKGQDLVEASTGNPALSQQLNITGLCAPVALAPTAVAHNPINFFTYVLAEDGVNASCIPGITGGNHVVGLPPAITPSVPPVVVTDPTGSGISGVNGDLALVLDEYAFPSPYGFGCDAPSTGQPTVLDCNGPPLIGSSSFALEITDAPPNKAIYLLFGFQPLSQVLPSGCTLLVQISQPAFLLGTTDGNGKLTVVFPIPNSTPVGLQTYQQCVFSDSGFTILSNGLLLHFGP